MEGNEIIFLGQDSAEGGYEAKAMGYSIFTEADTIGELREMVRDAVACHFDDEKRPIPSSLLLSLQKKDTDLHGLSGFTRRRPEPDEGIKSAKSVVSAKSASRFCAHRCIGDYSDG